MLEVYANRIATAVPANDVHRFFIDFAASQLSENPRQQAIFGRMAERAGIDHRFSCFAPSDDPVGASLDRDGIFLRNAFPGTAKRMEMFAEASPVLAASAVEKALDGDDRTRITHLIVTTCTGFSAPGLDLELVARCGLPTGIERTIIGFMGCYAAINALKLARHIVRSEREARVLIVNLEICTLHLKQTDELEKLLSFCLWGDGCAASVVSADPSGLRLDGFHSIVDAESRELMTWNIKDHGFDMFLSGQVPAAIYLALREKIGDIVGNKSVSDIELWAIHPGGKSILDAVERSLDLAPDALDTSRGVLRDCGNMSSATVMFVLERMLAARKPRQVGCAMAFGPGLTAETMMFQTSRN